MKKSIFLSLLISASTLPAIADSHLISLDTIPESAQIFANSNFADKKIASVEAETMFFGLITDGYEINFIDGSKIEFTSDGDWIEISTNKTPVPSDLVPEKITQYVKKNFKDSFIKSIEKEDYGFKIELSNNINLNFDKNFIFLGVS